MERFRYLIVGGGMTADSATEGIRSVDADGSIGMIAEEPDPPYDRPPLTKGLWKGKPIEGIWRGTAARGVQILGGRKAVSLDPQRQEVVDDQGTTYRYESLLLATGGTPKRHPAIGAAPLYYRTIADYRTLRQLAVEYQRFFVVGGGFIGSEIAAALAMHGRRVTIAFPESGLCGTILPPELSGILNRYYEAKGVRVLHGKGVASMAATRQGTEVCLHDGSRWTADKVVAGLGIAPNTALAIQAGLNVDNGILVDEHLRTSQPRIFAAGDVASFPCAALGQRVRLEHEDNANATGALAGRNMAGSEEAYHYLPYFYSDLFDLGYEAIGETNPSLQTIIEWAEPHERGVVFYVRAGRVRGVVLWGLFGKLDAARELIAAPGPHRSASLKAWARDRLAL